jgi:hypothetical protein
MTSKYNNGKIKTHEVVLENTVSGFSFCEDLNSYAELRKVRVQTSFKNLQAGAVLLHACGQRGRR